MKNTRGRGRHSGCHGGFRAFGGHLTFGAQAITGKQISVWRSASPSAKIKAHIDACHSGKVDENCNGCRELMKEL